MGDEVVPVLCLLETGKGHLGTWNVLFVSVVRGRWIWVRGIEVKLEFRRQMRSEVDMHRIPTSRRR